MTPQKISDVMGYIKAHLNGEKVSREQVNEIGVLHTKFNTDLKFQMDRNSNQGCIYCIIGKTGSVQDSKHQCYLKIGYSTYGGNIHNRLRSHASNLFNDANFIPLFITPVHNETIERQFHYQMKSKSTPLHKYKQNGGSKTFYEIYPVHFSIVQSLNEYLENLSTNKNCESQMTSIF